VPIATLATDEGPIPETYWFISRSAASERIYSTPATLRFINQNPAAAVTREKRPRGGLRSRSTCVPDSDAEKRIWRRTFEGQRRRERDARPRFPPPPPPRCEVIGSSICHAVSEPGELLHRRGPHIRDYVTSWVVYENGELTFYGHSTDGQRKCAGHHLLAMKNPNSPYPAWELPARAYGSRCSIAGWKGGARPSDGAALTPSGSVRKTPPQPAAAEWKKKRPKVAGSPGGAFDNAGGPVPQLEKELAATPRNGMCPPQRSERLEKAFKEGTPK